jgi:hypothetical protein
MKKFQRKNNKASNLFIFSSTLLAVTSAALLFAPVIKTNADETAEVTVEVNPIISLSLDKSSVNFDITPTVAGVFDSGSIVATVDTNSSGGYELYFSSEDSGTAMTSLVTESTIASDFSGTVTSSTMAANKWGYSTDATNFAPIPALASHAKIKNLDHVPTSSERNTTVTIGTKIANTLPSGTYSKRVVFSAIAHPSKTPPTDMQSFSCLSLPNVGDTTTLKDLRDQNEYTVKKLADGKCWMTDNLRLINQQELTSENTNLPENETWSIPASSINGFSSQRANNAYLTANGGLYTFYTATAGWGTNSVTVGHSSKDICPKGWQLPTGGYGGAFAVLYSYYNSPALMQQGDPNFKLGGYAYQSYHSGNNSYGRYWSSSTSDTVNGYFLRLDYSSSGEYSEYATVDATAAIVKYQGLSVRCIAKN